MLNDVIKGEIPLVINLLTIIFGADVSHPLSNKDSSPSMAAVCSSVFLPLLI